MANFEVMIFTPHDHTTLAVFYFFWMFVYVAVHLIWDINTDRTPKFHLTSLRSKSRQLFAAATLASSILIAITLFDATVAKVATDNIFPFVIASFSGILYSVSELCPYEDERYYAQPRVRTH